MLIKNLEHSTKEDNTMDKKGLNFLAGLGGLWLLWKIYSIGWFHKIGFLAVNYAVGSDLSESTYSSTPLALLAALLIDAIAVFGSLLIISFSGLWDLLLQGGSFFQDLLVTLKEYLEGFKKDIPIKEDVKDLEPVKEDINPLEVILLEIKNLGEQQKNLQVEIEKLKDKPNE
jgi:hypothetical protein